MSLVTLGHVLAHGGVAMRREAAHMRCHAFAAMQDFHCGGGEAGFHLLAGQLVGHAVVMLIDLDVVIDRSAVFQWARI